jgi:Phospholipase_D-nuclease N-terminal
MTQRVKPTGKTLGWLASRGLVLPRRTPWKDLDSRQRRAIILRGAAQFAVLVVALNDLRQRPPGQIRGPKIVWAAVCLVNYLGIGPAAYFLVGRRRSDLRRTATSEGARATG